MDILLIIISLLSLILSSIALFFTYRILIISKTFFGDKKIKEKLLHDLNEYFEETKNAIAQNKQLNDFIDKIIEENKTNISTVVAKRFNPYEESGGDLSFCVVMLNREKSGVMMTSLHGRERTRIYLRTIINGASNVELLYDEKEALKEALDSMKFTPKK